MEEKLTKRRRREVAKEQKRKERQKEILVHKMRKFLVWVFAAGLVLFVGFRAWGWLSAPSPEVAGIAIEVREDDWIRGNRQAQTTLLEYGDYQCPSCATYNPLVKQIGEEFPDGLKIIYRHFPIPGHQNAIPSAKASEASGRQGKFWEMHDILYDRQKDWESDENAKEKFILVAKNCNLFLNIIKVGIIKRKSITDNEASTKLKFRKASAEEASWFNKPK